jgi:hypothetical protein
MVPAKKQNVVWYSCFLCFCHVSCVFHVVATQKTYTRVFLRLIKSDYRWVTNTNSQRTHLISVAMGDYRLMHFPVFLFSLFFYLLHSYIYFHSAHVDMDGIPTLIRCDVKNILVDSMRCENYSKYCHDKIIVAF